MSTRTGRFPETAGEVKVVNVVDNRATDHTVLMTKVDGQSYPPLADKGLRGEYTFFQVVGAGVVAAHYDPRKLRREAPFVGKNDTSHKFMIMVDDGTISWEKIPNGEEIDPDRLQELADG